MALAIRLHPVHLSLGGIARGNNSQRRNFEMRNLCVRLYMNATKLQEESGQDLIEYALTAALIALAATAGMNTVATDINTAFSNVGSKLTVYTS
jgi:pilus assembly protein Flp/PilA